MIASIDCCPICQDPLSVNASVSPFACRIHFVHSPCAGSYHQRVVDPKCPVCQSPWAPSLISELAIMSTLPVEKCVAAVAATTKTYSIADWIMFLCCNRVSGPPFSLLPDRRMQVSNGTGASDYQCAGCHKQVNLADFLWLQDYLSDPHADNYCGFHGSRTIVWDVTEKRVHFACTCNVTEDQPQLIERCTGAEALRAYEGSAAAPFADDASMMSWPHGGALGP
jgi:hypothetical protein